ncbi:MAG: RsmE family RNA methyltransferase, partial [Acidimicrobiales bacterium]
MARGTERPGAQVFVQDPARPRLSKEDRHHLATVLRLRTGTLVIAADGKGTYSLCRFDAGELRVEEGVFHEERLEPRLTVGFAPTKGDRPEWVVQKLTELGVDRIVSLRTERSVVRWSGARAEHATERLAKVAAGAAAQSRRLWLPEISGPVSLGDFAKRVADDGGALALADEQGQSPSSKWSALAV